MSRRFIAIGECMVELAPSGGDAYRLGFSGDTFNTAWYARRLLSATWRVDYVTAVGLDAISDRMIAFINAAGIGTQHIQRRADRSVGLYLIDTEDGERSFTYWRSDSAARRLLSASRSVAEAIEGSDVIYFSGTSLAILPSDHRRLLRKMISAARARGAIVAFDPNLRPALWPSRDEMRQEIMEAAATCDIALPSHQDEASCFGDADTAETARRYAWAGATLVAVKNGSGELACLSDGRITRQATPSVRDIVDTTAAGDSFNAGFLAARLEGSSVPDALSAGARIAGKVIQHRGALAQVEGRPDRVRP